MKNKKITYSKLLPILTGFIFCIALYVAFNVDISNIYDTTIYTSAISVTGAIFGSTVVWYSKKASSENQYKLRMGLYSESIDQRLRYNEAMMKLRQEYCVDDMAMMQIDEDGNADEFMQNALDNAVNTLDEAQTDADSQNQIENFGL